MVLLLDDFHNIHTVRMPDNLKLSKATRMASVLLDIHLEIPPLKKTQPTVCPQGLENYFQRAGDCLQRWYCKKTDIYKNCLTSLPQQCQQLKAKDIQKQIKQFRCLLRVSCFLFLTGFHSCGG